MSTSIVERFLAGDRAALSRLITWAENRDERFAAAMSVAHARVGRGWRIGITGPPGAGKSTLVNELAKHLRTRGRTVGVLAVDPSSPLSGGALLGDRIRMEERTLDPGVFIRSMASRGSHGGLARAAVDACDLMDAFGIDEILLETVGVGQAEYEIVSATDTALVVLCPGAGDGIQAMKAGILEVADVLVVNKSDLPGAERLALDLDEAVHIRQAGRAAWQTPVVSASASKGDGIEDVVRAIESHREFLRAGRLQSTRRQKRLEQVRHLLVERIGSELWGPAGFQSRAEALLDSGAAPYDIVESLQRAIVDGASTRGERQS
ncbi:MAG: methylmalonyl Co-A mutase-associated GTPase MeaB [Planctomycetota bacterium]